MLSNESISLAIQVLQSLKDKGVRGVRPVENTPLAILARPTGITVDATQTLQSLGEQISMMVNGNFISDQNAAPTAHTTNIDAFINDFRAITVRHVDYARNVVKPFVVELCENCVEYLKTFVPESISAYEVRVLNTPDLFQNAALRAWANTSAEVPVKFIPNLFMPNVTVQEIRENYLVSKIASIKKDLDVWAATLSDERLMEIWNAYFGPRESAATDGSLGAIAGVVPGLVPRPDFDTLLFGLIVTNSLVDNPPVGVRLTLSAFNSEVTLIGEKLRAWYCHEFDLYQADLKSGHMAFYVNGSQMVVYPESYKEFIAKGGQADAILGRLVSGRSVYTIDDYLAAQAELLSSWEQFTSIKFMASNSERFVRARETMVSFFTKAIEADTDPVLVDKARLVDAFKRRVDELSLETFSQLGSFQDFALKAVCETRFAHTNAYEILSGINRVSEHNPRIQGREAASLAVIEYLPRWMATTMKAF